MEYSSTLPTDDPYTLGIYAAIVVTGLVNCFFGTRVFKYALGMLLAIAGAGAGAYLAVQLEVASDSTMFVGIGLGALIGLIVSFVFLKAAAAIAGALLGYALLSPNIGGLEELPRFVVLIGGCGLGALGGVLLVNPVITIATSFIGAFQVVYGGLFFVDGTQILILGEDPAAGWQILSARQMPFVAMMALGSVGMLVQFSRKWRRKKRND
jgi:hypothetical protein